MGSLVALSQQGLGTGRPMVEGGRWGREEKLGVSLGKRRESSGLFSLLALSELLQGSIPQY